LYADQVRDGRSHLDHYLLGRGVAGFIPDEVIDFFFNLPNAFQLHHDPGVYSASILVDKAHFLNNVGSSMSHGPIGLHGLLHDNSALPLLTVSLNKPQIK
jgi:hypothetical protein